MKMVPLRCCAVQSGPDDGGRKHLRNVGKVITNYTAQHPKTVVGSEVTGEGQTRSL
jgi:hypothetical protein